MKHSEYFGWTHPDVIFAVGNGKVICPSKAQLELRETPPLINYPSAVEPLKALVWRQMPLAVLQGKGLTFLSFLTCEMGVGKCLLCRWPGRLNDKMWVMGLPQRPNIPSISVNGNQDSTSQCLFSIWNGKHYQLLWSNWTLSLIFTFLDLGSYRLLKKKKYICRESCMCASSVAQSVVFNTVTPWTITLQGSDVHASFQ